MRRRVNSAKRPLEFTQDSQLADLLSSFTFLNNTLDPIHCAITTRDLSFSSNMIPLHHITPHFPRSASSTSFRSSSLDWFWISILIYCCWCRVSLLVLLWVVVVVVGWWWLWGRWWWGIEHVHVGGRRQAEINCWRHLERFELSLMWLWSGERRNRGIELNFYSLFCFGNMDDLTHARVQIDVVCMWSCFVWGSCMRQLFPSSVMSPNTTLSLLVSPQRKNTLHMRIDRRSILYNYRICPPAK